MSPEKALVASRIHLDSHRSNSYLHSSATQTDLALFPLPVENGTLSDDGSNGPLTSTPDKHKQKTITKPHESVLAQNILRREHSINDDKDGSILSKLNALNLNNNLKDETPKKQSNIKSGKQSTQ